MATIFRPPLYVVIYPKQKTQPEYTVTLSSLLTPNPAQPFQQTLWPRPSDPIWKAKADDVTNLLPVQTVVVVAAPFYQNVWLNALTPKVKVNDTTPAVSLPLYSPNPVQPFSLFDWPSSAVTRKTAAVAETVELLLPIYSPNPSAPFVNSTDAASPRFAVQPVKSDIIVNLLPLQIIPVGPMPFSQADWPSAKSASYTQNLGLTVSGEFIPFIPPPPFKANTDWLMRARRRGLR
jgi:hypothetical protein